MGGVGPLTGPDFRPPRGQGSIGLDVGNQMDIEGMADPVADEGFLAGAVQHDAAASHLNAEPGAERLVQRVLLVAEAAADIGLDDTDLSPGTAKGLPHDAADNMGNLGGGTDG